MHKNPEARSIILAIGMLACLTMLPGCQSKNTVSASSPTPATTTASNGIRFTDVAAQAGLKFLFEIPGKRPMNILQSMSGGCAFLDYDADGNLDILLISQKIALFRGDGRGAFTDVTATVLPPLKQGFWMGVAVGDYDNDGFDDLYISAYRGGVLLHNEGGKQFKDVSVQSSITSQPYGSSCSFGDYDNDGKIDLFIGNYVQFGSDSVQLCKVKDIYTSCSPTVYEAEKGVLYRNLGGGKFKDVSAETGMDKTTGKVLGVLFLDVDNSGRQSIYLANDEVSSDLMYNKGNGKFENIGEMAGVAYNELGKPFGGMGVDYGDIDHDGKTDMIVGTFTVENKMVLMNQGDRLFVDRSEPMGVALPARNYLSFGAQLFDADNNGRLDLIFCNGYIADNVAEYEPTRTYREPTLLFRNDGATFADISKEAGEAFQRPIVGRGLAVGDYDNDGKIDILIADGEGAPLLLHNDSNTEGKHSVTLRLIGTRSARNAYGSRIIVETKSGKSYFFCHSDGSYLSASDSRIHIGLGAEQSAKITVKWQDGSSQTQEISDTGQVITIRQNAK